jgi:hypothetical protein
MKMDLQRVTSSNLQAIGYDEQSKTLRILFLGGAVYDYFNVPVSLHRSLMTSHSKGHFFQEHVVGQFRYEKVNPNLREEGHMGQNKQQKAAAERVAKPAPAVQPTAPAQPAPPAAASTQPSKQQQTIDKLREAWMEKRVDLSKITIRDDGKFKLVIVDAGWPTVQIGPTGGIVVLELRSYSKAFEAAVDGLALYQKQQGRDAKKPATSPTQPAPAAPLAPEPKESTTQKKKRQDAAVEAKLQSRTA